MQLKFVTFNLRSGTNDGINTFKYRDRMIVKKLQKEKPDIVAFQEYMPVHREYFKKHLSEYTIIGHGRNADYSGEGVAVAYRKEAFTLMGYDSFWLSPTPYVPASRYAQQSRHPRICAALTLLHRDCPTPFRVYCVHLDHEGKDARLLGIEQILEKAVFDKNKIDYPCIIAGDFNALPDEETIKFCDNYSPLPLVDITKSTEGTFHNFGAYAKKDEKDKKIDYIYAEKDLAGKVKQVTLWKDMRRGTYLSDHYPVCAVFDI